jgi:hypothetical protein
MSGPGETLLDPQMRYDPYVVDPHKQEVVKYFCIYYVMFSYLCFGRCLDSRMFLLVSEQVKAMIRQTLNG